MSDASRFATISSRGAKWVLGLLLLLLATSFWFAVSKSSPKAQPISIVKSMQQAQTQEVGGDDLRLYKAIIDRMRAGENYYVVAVEEQRARGFPTQPFVTVRLPTLAFVLAHLGTLWGQLLEIAIALAALYVWYQKLAEHKMSRWRRWALIGLLAAGLSPVLNPKIIYMHEIWAGALIALSIGLYRPKVWLPSFLIAACALALRELVLPFVLLMAAFALLQRRWVETGAWVGLILAFLGYMFLHAHAVSGVVQPNDPSAPSWMLANGPAAALHFLWQSLPLSELPAALAFPMIVLGLFGWLCWRTETALFCLLLVLGYMLAFAMTGRPNNFYWGYLVSPFVLMGFIFLGPGLKDLQTAIRRGGAKA
ncbi:glycosyltransferase family protein [Aquidulcibacter paucihalophilus]|uniref:hypothetical protein n=1 Tax=Aquidulcibacter paucihalophilus TaxID=1978549 RepID=UPI000A1966A6|nr:hypothetical protein [Aquidulcibacter paucihalophilus]